MELRFISAFLSVAYRPFADCSLSSIPSNIANYLERRETWQQRTSQHLSRIAAQLTMKSLATHVPRRNGRAESNSSARESGTDEQLDLDFGGSDSQSGKRAVRGHDAPELDDLTTDVDRASEAPTSNDEPASLREVFEGNPKLRAAWRDAHTYRETLAPPEEAKAATVLLGDLNRMEALFFRRVPKILRSSREQ